MPELHRLPTLGHVMLTGRGNLHMTSAECCNRTDLNIARGLCSSCASTKPGPVYQATAGHPQTHSVIANFRAQLSKAHWRIASLPVQMTILDVLNLMAPVEHIWAR